MIKNNKKGKRPKVSCFPQWGVMHTEIVKLADKIFHLDKKIKEDCKGDANRITQERVLQIGPVLHTIKNILDMLESALDKNKEPELFKAMKYALDEYPCLLNALQDGTLDFSNNATYHNLNIIPTFYLTAQRIAV